MNSHSIVEAADRSLWFGAWPHILYYQVLYKIVSVHTNAFSKRYATSISLLNNQIRRDSLVLIRANDFPLIRYAIRKEPGDEFHFPSVGRVKRLSDYTWILHESFGNEPFDVISMCMIRRYTNNESCSPSNVHPIHGYVKKRDFAALHNIICDKTAVNTTVESCGWTVLHSAAYFGDVSVLAFLYKAYRNRELDHLLDFDGKLIDNLGRGLMHIAAREGNHGAVKYLLDIGFEADEPEKYPAWSVLHYSAWNGDERTIQLLIDREGNTEPRTALLRKSPLHVAAQAGNLNALRLFIEKGVCDINVEDIWGETALCYAAAFDQLNCLEYLIEKGANVAPCRKFDYNMISLSSIETFYYLLKKINISPLCSSIVFSHDGSCAVIKYCLCLKEIAADKNIKKKDSIALNKIDLTIYLTFKETNTLLCCQKHTEALLAYKNTLQLLTEHLTVNYKNQDKLQQFLVSVEGASSIENIESLHQLLLQSAQLIYSYDHTTTLKEMHAFAKKLERKVELEDAYKLLADAYAYMNLTLDPDKEFLLEVQRDLARVLFGLRRFDESIEVLRAMQNRLTDEVEILRVKNKIADALFNKGDKSEARVLMKEVLKERTNLLGPRHHETVITKVALISIS